MGGCQSRSDAVTIAQPFMAGSGVNQMKKSREGRQKSMVAVRKHLSSRTGLWEIADHESQP